MKNISTSSWHYKIWRFMQPSHKYEEVPTVCEYWSRIFIAAPLACALFAMFAPFFPFVWVIGKLEDKFRGKMVCPIGRVNFKTAQAVK